jgi:hypothetical protein
MSIPIGNYIIKDGVRYNAAGGVLGSYSISGDLTLGAKVVKVNNRTTAGLGVAPVFATASSTANNAALTNAINYTPPATAGTYRVSGVVNVTAWTTPATFAVNLGYKDASGNARTEVAHLRRGSNGADAAAVTAVDRWFFDFAAVMVDNSGTAITVSTAGTFTGAPVYDFAAVLEELI